MKNFLLHDFMAALTTLDDNECLMAKIEVEVAPIMAGLKPSALMTFSKDSRNSYQRWEACKTECAARLNLHYYELKKSTQYILVLFYNPDLLADVLKNDENRSFLHNMGYPDGLALPQILSILQERFDCHCPHEIGLFLGIAKEDVDGFIRNQGGKCLFCGYWKVYHKPHEAYNLFRNYDLARYKVMQQICRRSTVAAVPA